jgi:hypothetical protein
MKLRMIPEAARVNPGLRDNGADEPSGTCIPGGANDEVLLGGLLGDFWRGAPDPQWPAAIRVGVVLHRKIDVYTDSTRTSLPRAPCSRRR